MMFGPVEAVKRIEKHEGGLLPVPWRQFALKLFDPKPQSVDGNTGFIGKLIGDAPVIG